MKRLLSSLAFIIVSCWQTAAQPDMQLTDTARVYEVRFDSQFPPFEYLNERGNPDGFNVAIFSRLMERLALKYNLRPSNISDIVHDLGTNEVDMATGLFYNSYRASLMNFCIPFTHVTISIVCRNDRKFKSVEELRGRNVVVQKNDMLYDWLMSTMLTPHVVAMPDILSGLTLVAENDSVDAMLTYNPTADHYIGLHDIEGLTIVKADIRPQPCSIVTNRNNDELLYMLNIGLNQMKADGEYDMIYNRWFGLHSRRFDISYVLITVFFFVLMIALGRVFIVFGNRRSNQLLDSLFENIREGILVLGNDGVVLRCNAALSGMLGGAPKGQPFASIFKSPADLQQSIEQAQTRTLTCTETLCRFDGSTFTASITMLPFNFNFTDYVVAVVSDMTKRDVTDRDLNDTRFILTQALNSGRISVWIMSLKTLQFSHIYGRTFSGRQSLTFADLLQLCPDDDARDKMKWSIECILNNDYHGRIYPVHITDSQGHDVYLEKTITKLDDERAVVTLLDVTENNIMKRQMEIVNRKMQLAIKCSNLTLYEFDLRTNTLTRFREEPVKIPWNEYLQQMVHPDYRQQLANIICEVSENNTQFFEVECKLLMDRGKDYVWSYLIGAAAEFDSAGHVEKLVGFWRDDSTWHAIIDELQQLSEKAESASRLKSAFIANMNHEIRTPLNAIVGFSEILSQPNDLTDEERRNYVSIINNNNELLLQLVSDVLDISRMDSDRSQLKFSFSTFDVNALLQEQASMATIKNRNRDVEIRLELLPENVSITSDRGRVSQVVSNFVTNAMKHTARGTITISASVGDERTICFSVADTGCGIPKNEQEHIFERFVKLNKFVPGTGLGLSICRQIAKLLNGSIGLDSTEGVGSTFRLTLPIRNSQSCIRCGEVSARSIKPKVLIAESLESNNMIMKAVLRNDYDLRFVCNGLEVRQTFADYQPDLVILDVSMPLLNVSVVVDTIRSNSKVPVVAMTTNIIDANAYIDMFDAFVRKPVCANELLPTLDHLLN